MSADLHVMRARLTPSSRRDRKQSLVHDFRNDLLALALSAGAGDDRLTRFYTVELTRKYEEAVNGNTHQKEPKRAAA